MELQALEGKDVKDLLLNVGSGGGAAAAPTSGGAAAGGAPAEEAKEEKEEEGTISTFCHLPRQYTDTSNSKGRVRRGYGFRSFRLERSFHSCLYFQMHGHGLLTVQHGWLSSFQ